MAGGWAEGDAALSQALVRMCDVEGVAEKHDVGI